MCIRDSVLQFNDNKTYVINFWATWCAPCIKELPYFEKINKYYKNKGVEVILVSLDFPSELDSKLKPFIFENKIDSRIIFNGETDPNKSLYTVLSVGFPKDICNSMLLFSLDIFGVAASGGSACSSGSTKGSHVLAELPSMEKFQTVRFSLCRYNTIEEVDYTLDKIKSIVIKGK